MTTIYQQIRHNTGIPLGGIGAGTIEIRPDGLFHEWEIFNAGQWNAVSSAHRDQRPINFDDFFFSVRTKTADGTVITRFLALDERLHDLYCYAYMRSVQAITFEGNFPVATLTYEDEALPVEIEAEVFSPFVPLDSRTSGTPGFYVHFSVKNITSSPVEVSIMGLIRNAVGFDQEKRTPHNRLEDFGEAKAVVLSADNLTEGEFSTGDMTFSAAGGEVTYITGSYCEEHKAIVPYRAKYGMKSYSFFHQFKDDGKLPNLNAETAPSVPKDFRASALTVGERKKQLKQWLQYPWAYDKYERMKLVDPEWVDSEEFLDQLAGDIAEFTDRQMPWGWAALCSSFELEPEAEDAALFTVSWFFPNHISPTGENIGHQYEHWFKDSLEVTQYLLEDFAEIRDKTFALPDAIHDSSMPEEAADAVTSQLSTLTKCTWWTKAGHFGVWEGLGCCGFHTTDITYQGSFPIISLFPDLQKAQMEHGAKFQREDGRVHHFFHPDFTAIDEPGYARVDMNQQFVMLAARDYFWSGDRGYLDRLWPNIIRAMDNTKLLDTDGDGLPDSDTKWNTYDAWDFTGCPSYISSLWLGALKVAVRLAKEMGDSERAKNWQADYEKGLKSFEEKLWNGEYYILWRDGDLTDECCMSDQMSGDWFAGASGWDPILKPERIKQALGNIMEYNFRPSEGLLNASYPPGKPRRFAASSNYQADAPWTGIEYTLACTLIQYGMVEEGMMIVRDIDSRYMQAGRVWSHVECGGHYYRAMSSWTVMIALSGFKWDQPTGSLTLAPAIKKPVWECPFFTSTAWGNYYQENSLTGRIVNIELAAGEMTLRSLSLPKLAGFEEALVLVNDEEVPCKVTALGDGIRMAFKSPITLTADDTLTVTA